MCLCWKWSLQGDLMPILSLRFLSTAQASKDLDFISQQNRCLWLSISDINGNMIIPFVFGLRSGSFFLAGLILCLSSWEGHHDPDPDLNHDPDPDPDYGRAILLIQDSSSLPSLSFFRLHLTSSWWVKGRLWKKSTLIYFAPSPSAAWMCWLFYAHRIW